MANTHDRTYSQNVRKGLRYLNYVLKDGIRFMPGFLTCTIIVHIINAVLAVWFPVLIAEIFSVVGNLNEETMPVFRRDIVLLCINIGLPAVLGSVEQVQKIFMECGKEKFYGWKMFDYAKHISLEALENPKTLDSFQKAEAAYTDYEAMTLLITRMFDIIQMGAVCIGTIYVTGSFSAWLIPFSLLGIIPHFAVTVYTEKRYYTTYRRQTSVRRRIQYLWRLFCLKDPVKEMRTLGFGSYMKKLWVDSNVTVVSEMEAVELAASRMWMTGAVIKNTCYALNIAIAFILMVRGNIAVGQFAACISAFATLQGNLIGLGDTVSQFFELYHRAEEYYDFFQIEAEKDGEESYRPFQQEITLKDVHFRYSGSDRDSLNGVDLAIKKGEHVVVVGVNGSGKTTMSKVLTGAYLASSGTVSYDGQDMKALERNSLYRHISLVTQDFVHYNFTMRENIGISDLSHINDDRRLNKTVEAVEMEELIRNIGGLDSQLGREFGGRELSGGEWQKVAIARGMFKDSDLIILDEPTSALDPLVEYDILTKFVDLIQDKTSVIISHRVGICRAADKVVVMKDGRVVECGTHDTLKEAGGEYSRIWNEQAKWY